MTKIRDYPNDSLLFEEGAEPATPASGTVRIYAKPDGGMYAKDDAGTETPLGGGGGGGIPDAPSDGSTYGRKDGEWEAVAEPEVPTLQAVLEKGDTTDQQLIFTMELGEDVATTVFSALGLHSSIPTFGLNSYFTAEGFKWEGNGGGDLSLLPSIEFLSASEQHVATIPYKTGTILLDSDIGTLVAAADAIPVWVEITQAAYDALDPPDPNTLYVVID